VGKCNWIGLAAGSDSSRKNTLPKSALISIVDDDESVREATRGLVRSLGYVAATFASAEEFLDSEHRHDTSCIIADVHMPGLSGVDMQSHLVAEGHRLPMIFVTAFPDERLRARALAAGAFGFLSKPFNEEHLIGCLDKALNSRNAGNEE